MAFSRHNIEKHRLIEMVRQNPILWDCRLPHYKRSDKKKDGKWCELGLAFNVTGERVQRTFTSLREIFRRELNHEKLLGDRFKSKWEYYHAMSFLKDVIRERKTRDRNGEEYASLHPKIRKWNEQTDAIIRDLRLVRTPPRPANYSSRSTTPSISIKEEFTDLDGDDEGIGGSSGTHFRRENDEVIPNKSTNPDVGGPPASSHQSQAVKNTTPPYNHTKSTHIAEEEDDYSTPAIIQQTPREILYTKFGEFLSARLNTLNETVANDVMNRILLLIAEN